MADPTASDKQGGDGAGATLATEVTAQHGSTSTTIVNASGHVEELDRRFSLLSVAGLGLTVGNVWPAVGGSILVAIFNGGPPGVLYEFLVVSVCYWPVAASIAELASAIPSSAGVYHWASVTPGHKWGRFVGFLAGWWNYLAWVFGAASMSSIFANTVVQMYALNNPDFAAATWHVFLAYILTTWLACLCVCFANSAMPFVNKLGIYAILGGFIVTLVTVTAMPGRGGRPPHATSSFVWSEWQADIGYPDGMVFLLGMLNGAFSCGPVDATTHLAEEIPQPERNVPIAILMQVGIGFVTGFAYLVALMYSINDYPALFASPYPIAEIYRQATGSNAGAIGLLALVAICIWLTVIGLYITCGRTLWALARDGASPFPGIFGQVHPRLGMPLWSTLATAVLVTLLGVIYLGNTTAFNAFVGSFVLLSSSSFLACILPNLLTGRTNITYGQFHMRKSGLGFMVNGVACVYMLVFFVIYCFPGSLPTSAASMNYASVLWGGLTIIVGVWWLLGARKGYVGPLTTGGGVHS
ncbi:amino acid/polyamine transporter I [Microdochium bolleyi]|uniref:Amino acid/polyamine transporter I n=1 Tax=Microdochium bolleyi TaxID=196109 RepID=A0A136IN79_9PEZI|nr:amino acid/polyamine transporter I [Microdochium bolleyi]